MKIIIFQGNYPEKYNQTRHNVGFAFADFLCGKLGGNWQDKPKFKAKIAEISLENEKILLVKPQTFYNETGFSARAVCDFFKINPAQDMLVIHDDLSLDFGVIRTRTSGSAGGNNGLKSIIAAFGEQFPRIKIGIANELLSRMDSANFVLANFSKEEKDFLPQIFEVCEKYTRQFTKNQLKNEKFNLR